MTSTNPLQIGLLAVAIFLTLFSTIFYTNPYVQPAHILGVNVVAFLFVLAVYLRNHY